MALARALRRAGFQHRSRRLHRRRALPHVSLVARGRAAASRRMRTKASARRAASCRGRVLLLGGQTAWLRARCRSCSSAVPLLPRRAGGRSVARRARARWPLRFVQPQWPASLLHPLGVARARRDSVVGARAATARPAGGVETPYGQRGNVRSARRAGNVGRRQPIGGALRFRQWFRESAELQATGMLQAWLPAFADLRHEPGFKDLVRDQALPDYWNRFGWPEFCWRTLGDDFECD